MYKEVSSSKKTVPRTFCHMGRFVPWDVLSVECFVLGRFVLGRFILERFVCASNDTVQYNEISKFSEALDFLFFGFC